MNVKDFENIHSGETMLLVGNGPNLHLTPPELFDMPSIGMNTIHKYKNWRPSYWIGVDGRIREEFGAAIENNLVAVPKFVPIPKLRTWTGKNFVYFRNKPGALWSSEKGTLWQREFDTEITYGCVMHVAIKLARHMGASTILIVGMEHDPENFRQHFWGLDEGMGMSAPIGEWIKGYGQLCNGLANEGRRLINISENTFVPEEIIPRDDWRKYASAEAIGE